MNRSRQDADRVIIIEREDVREVTWADPRVLPNEEDPLSLRDASDVSIKVANSRTHLWARPPQHPPNVCVYRIEITIGPHTLADDVESRRITGGRLERHLAKVDDVPLRPSFRMISDVLTHQVRPD